MKFVRLEIEQGQLCVNDVDAGRMLASIKFGVQLEPSLTVQCIRLSGLM